MIDRKLASFGTPLPCFTNTALLLCGSVLFMLYSRWRICPSFTVLYSIHSSRIADKTTSIFLYMVITQEHVSCVERCTDYSLPSPHQAWERSFRLRSSFIFLSIHRNLCSLADSSQQEIPSWSSIAYSSPSSVGYSSFPSSISCASTTRSRSVGATRECYEKVLRCPWRRWRLVIIGISWWVTHGLYSPCVWL